ncbi:MAG: hypothetical protein HY698_07585 [Deltaproteobacteria bacterium]|nr:hypothetical protein [Deltaproteobacteria bacterium]
MVRCSALAVVAVLACSSLVAWGAPDAKKRQEEARALYQEGDKFFKLAEYDKAIQAFKKSFLLSNAPLLLFNIAQAYRLKGDCAQAIRFYQNYLNEDPNPTNKKDVEVAMGQCAAPTAKGPDTDAAANAPVESVGQRAQETIDIGSREGPEIGAAPVVQEPKPAAEVRDLPGRSLRLAGLIVAGAGMAMAGTGIYLGLDAHATESSVEEHEGPWDPVDEERERSAKKKSFVASLLTAGGIAAIAGGGALYYLGIRRQDAAELSLGLTSGGALLVWTCGY